MTEFGFCHHPTISPTNLSPPTKVCDSAYKAAPYHFLSVQVLAMMLASGSVSR
jgi:hypothetical protein